MIREFKSVTGCTDSVASTLLAKYNQSLEQALNAFYSEPQSSATSNKKGSTSSKAASTGVDPARLTQWFNEYKSPGEDCISDEQLGKFFTDAGVQVDQSALSLVVAYQLGCATYGEISRDEFMTGFTKMKCDSTAKLHTKLSSFESTLTQFSEFKPFYLWVFSLIKDEEQRKVVDTESVCEMWSLLLPAHFPLLQDWLHYVTQVAKLKSISKDVWSQLLEFARESVFARVRTEAFCTSALEFVQAVRHFTHRR